MSPTHCSDGPLPLPHSADHKEFTNSALSLGEGIAQSHEHQGSLQPEGFEDS